MKRIFLLISLLTSILIPKVFAQPENIELTINQAEELFFKNNHVLLTENYQVDMARADVITSRLFDNPEFSHENLLYNHETKKFLQTSYAFGQYNTSVSQLIKLAGKRNKTIKLAEDGVKLAEQEYFNLVRTLRYELRTTFYKIYFAERSKHVYDEQIASSEQLLKAYQIQFSQGNIALKDVVRIKSLIINLKSELVSLQNQLEDDYRDLKILCGIGANVQITLATEKPVLESVSAAAFSYNALLDSARANRADLGLAKTNLQYSLNNLALQKSMAVPDVQLSLSYDLKGNYPEKYTGIGISMPIPLFNRNQGEIKKARLQIDAATVNIQRQETLLENEVQNSYKTALRNNKLVEEIDPGFSTEFDQLIAGLNKNFRERNISLIEFLDLFESYKQNVIQLNNLQLEQMNSREEINYVTGSTIFK